MHFARFPRLHFAHLPTPLEALPRLSDTLGGPKLWIKRDDCTGLAGGGNKTRKLEFLLADALQRKADTIITQGATQSNHARQTVAIATRLGLDCHLLLENRTGSGNEDYMLNGNVLLDQILGAKLHHHAADTDMDAEMQVLADKLSQDGRRPYIIPGGGSNEIGALGYANAALELVDQANQRDLKIDHIVHATGSAGTQAGLVAGLTAINANIPVLGIGVKAPQEEQQAKVLSLARSTADMLASGLQIDASEVVANCDYVGDGYGIPTESMVEAVHLLAQTEAILLDPVYSGKGMAGLIDLIRKNQFKSSDNIVFIHTGGAQAIFAYRQALTNLVNA